MKKVIVSYKNIGETPLECLERVRIEQGIDKDIPMTYAGRLDPMAEGVIILLIGDECKNKEKYLRLDKEYEMEILVGVETDSYDVLGIINKIDINKKIEGDDILKYVGEFEQEYPKYSSKIIAMKDIPDDMPVKKVEIKRIDKLGEIKINGIDIAKNVLSRISLVKGDFRQGDIGEEWVAFGEEFANVPFKIITLKVWCSSGTYMRSLAYNLGGLAWSIKRTQVGEFK